MGIPPLEVHGDQVKIVEIGLTDISTPSDDDESQ